MNQNNVCVRDARADDRDFIVECNAAMAWETEQRRLDRDVLASGVATALAERRHGFYLIAECAVDPSEIRAGCLLVTTEWSDWRNGDWWWIQSVYVMPAARRHGVFRALYAETERRARAQSDVIGLRLYVERENARAQATYASLGMEETAYRLYEREFGNAGTCA